MSINELRECFKSRLKHAPEFCEEYKYALSILDEVEAYRKTMQSPEDVIRMQEKFFELSVECNGLKEEIKRLKGTGDNAKDKNTDA